MKKLGLILLLAIVFLNCEAQKIESSKKDFQFSELTFHSSNCNGTCPDISVNINSEKKIQLVRVIYNSKGQSDSSLSGTFKGTLQSKDYNKLIRHLKKCDFDSLKFPEVLCCDSSIKTLIVSYNEKYKRFKSMTPPLEASSLITFLTQLSTTVSLPKYNRPIDFEE